MENALCISKNDRVIVVYYVDDLLVFANADEDVAPLKPKLAENLNMKDLGISTLFLGIEILLHEGTVSLCQKGMIDKLLEQSQMKTSKPVKTPLSNYYGSHPSCD